MTPVSERWRLYDTVAVQLSDSGLYRDSNTTLLETLLSYGVRPSESSLYGDFNLVMKARTDAMFCGERGRLRVQLVNPLRLASSASLSSYRIAISSQFKRCSVRLHAECSNSETDPLAREREMASASSK